MGTSKKPEKKKPAPDTGTKKTSGLADEIKPQKRIIDDEDFEEPLDDLEGYVPYSDFEDDDDDF